MALINKTIGSGGDYATPEAADNGLWGNVEVALLEV